MRSLAFLVAPVLLADGIRKGRRSDSFSPYDNQPALGVEVCSEKQLQEILPKLQGCTFLTEFFDGMPSDGSCNQETMVCDQSVAAAIQRDYPGVKVLQQDAGAFFRSQAGVAQGYVAAAGNELSDDFYTEWRSYAAQMERVEAAVAGCCLGKGKATIEVVGQSHEGRDMKIVRFTGRGYQSGMPKVVLTFNLHAREWIAGHAGVYAVDKLVQKVNAEPDYLDGMEVVMMPMANPDGFIHSEGWSRFHRKNMNLNYTLCQSPAIWTAGVDLNRNFPFMWNQGGSSSIPCLDNYHGQEGGSEAETQVIMRVLQESPMSVMIDVHSFTQLVLSSWGYTTEDHPRKEEFAELGGKMKDAMEARHGAWFSEGPAAQTLYVASGTLTDYATSLGALGYCFELRPGSRLWSLLGFAPPASYILPSAEETFDGILVAIEHARAM